MEEEKPTDQYVVGFNKGYLLIWGMPEVAKTIASISTKSEWFEGFRNGLEVGVNEKIKAEKEQEVLRREMKEDLDFLNQERKPFGGLLDREADLGKNPSTDKDFEPER